MTHSLHTTAPGRGRTEERSNAIPEFAFIIVHSRAQPHRVGECGRVYGPEEWLLGRGGEGNFVHFFPQLPGELPPPRTSEESLGGDTLSRTQAEVRVVPAGVDIRNIGQRCMFVNGAETSQALLSINDRVRFDDEIVLLVTLRSKVMPPLREATVNHHPFGQVDADGFIGESPIMWATRDDVAIASTREDAVLITGGTGTGKELIANAIHKRSSRRHKAMVTVNASVSTESLDQASFCGNVKGFPNSDTPAREGYIAEANDSTLFLDEVADCPKELQAQLLRAIQQKEYQRLGESRARTSNVRFIGATNQPSSKFRGDFEGRFSRRIASPSLNERREDIPLLFRVVAARYCAPVPSLARLFQRWPSGEVYPNVSARLIEYLLGLPFEKNIRDLEALVTQRWSRYSSTARRVTRLRHRPALTAEPLPALAEPNSDRRGYESGLDAPILIRSTTLLGTFARRRWPTPVATSCSQRTCCDSGRRPLAHDGAPAIGSPWRKRSSGRDSPVSRRCLQAQPLKARRWLPPRRGSASSSV